MTVVCAQCSETSMVVMIYLFNIYICVKYTIVPQKKFALSLSSFYKVRTNTVVAWCRQLANSTPPTYPTAGLLSTLGGSRHREKRLKTVYLKRQQRNKWILEAIDRSPTLVKSSLREINLGHTFTFVALKVCP